MKALEWHTRFMKLAYHIARWSKDPSTTVGAVVVDERGHIVGTGYNGFPRKVADRIERYENKHVKYKMIVHAEVNALMDAGKEARGCALYTTFHPCAQCAAMLIQAGIRVVYTRPAEADERWKEDREIAQLMLREAGVHIITLEDGGSDNATV